jgi:hypothetical protein
MSVSNLKIVFSNASDPDTPIHVLQGQPQCADPHCCCHSGGPANWKTADSATLNGNSCPPQAVIV